MALFDFLGGEFIDVIHWVDDTRDTMVWRFERQGHAIKYGAKLTVREGQAAVFIHEGQLADVFTPGLYMLETNNLPILTTLQHWDHGFRSPFKSEVYFVNTTRFNDQKWGTKNPIICRDPEFGPVRLRAFGTYSMRVTDPGRFMTEIVGTDGEFTADEISFQIRNVIVQGDGPRACRLVDPGARHGGQHRRSGQARGRGHRAHHRGLRPLDPRALHREHLAAAGGSRRRSTSAPRWGSWAIWASSPNTARPRPWRRRIRPPAPRWQAAWARPWASGWRSAWARGAQRLRRPSPRLPHPLRRPPSRSGMWRRTASPRDPSRRPIWPGAWRRVR